MRNVVSISDVPVPLHNWLREEARRRSQKEGKRVGITTLVVEAVEQFKENVEGIRGGSKGVFENINVFPASVPRAFIDYGAISVKSQYRTFLPANQEGLAPENRTYFTINFTGYGEAKAYMSRGRLKIGDKNVWRDILTKLGIKPNDTFVIKAVKPTQYYEAQRQ